MSRKWFLLAFIPIAFALLTFAPRPASAKKLAKGEKVEFMGLVTGADGQPLAGVTVHLEAIRKKFRARRLRKEKVDTFLVSSLTTDRGEYSIHWPWNDYYNRYELVVTIPVRNSKGKSLHELQRVDITEQAKAGSPILSTLVVQDTTYLYTLRRFLASLDSEDENRIYEELGSPDKVEELEGGQDVSWWYFETGKVYRFSQGKLKDIVPFDPVKKF
ncbi:MAG: hypothetical protein K0U98_14930 [Deltaproteobacteria bacterium]|nr:hypothetical protein [Deltaproteobacteria bacterium]